jgi:hypothetical protein
MRQKAGQGYHGAVAGAVGGKAADGTSHRETHADTLAACILYLASCASVRRHAMQCLGHR